MYMLNHINYDIDIPHTLKSHFLCHGWDPESVILRGFTEQSAESSSPSRLRRLQKAAKTAPVIQA